MFASLTRYVQGSFWVYVAECSCSNRQAVKSDLHLVSDTWLIVLRNLRSLIVQVTVKPIGRKLTSEINAKIAKFFNELEAQNECEETVAKL